MCVCVCVCVCMCVCVCGRVVTGETTGIKPVQCNRRFNRVRGNCGGTVQLDSISLSSLAVSLSLTHRCLKEEGRVERKRERERERERE